MEIPKIADFMKILRVLTALLLPALFYLNCSTSPKNQKLEAGRRTNSTAPKPATQTGDAGTAIHWADDEELKPVLEQAQREKKPVFIECYATWCGPCKVMEQNVFTQPDLAEFLNKDFLNFRIDVDTEAGIILVSEYQIKAIPAMIFVDPKGVVLEKFVGMTSGQHVRTMGESALVKMKSK